MTAVLVLVLGPLAGYLVVAGALLGYFTERSPVRDATDVLFEWWVPWFWPNSERLAGVPPDQQDHEKCEHGLGECRVHRRGGPRVHEVAMRSWGWPAMVLVVGLSMLALSLVSSLLVLRWVGRTVVALPVRAGAWLARSRVPVARALPPREPPRE